MNAISSNSVQGARRGLQRAIFPNDWMPRLEDTIWIQHRVYLDAQKLLAQSEAFHAELRIERAG